MFAGKMPVKQVMAAFCAFGDDEEFTVECLLAGPTLDAIIKLVSQCYVSYPARKLCIDVEKAWADTMACYKSPCADPTNSMLRVVLNNRPAVDTGGVRRQL